MDKPSRKTSRRAIVLALVTVLAVAAAVRIWWVNECKYPYPYPEMHHAMGEWVELDGAFIDSNIENTQGYAIRVNGAELLSFQEYVDRYGAEGQEVPSLESVSDEKSILCLTMELRNSGDVENGAIFLGEIELMPRGLLMAYNYHPQLWGVSNPNIGPRSLVIGVLPGTTTVQHVPYVRGYGDPFAQALPTVDSYEFVVSNAPVRHVIDIGLD